MNLDIIINLNTHVALVCIFYWKQIESEIKSRQPFQSMINCLTNLMRFCNIEGGILYVVSYKKKFLIRKKIWSFFLIRNPKSVSPMHITQLWKPDNKKLWRENYKKSFRSKVQCVLHFLKHERLETSSLHT